MFVWMIQCRKAGTYDKWLNAFFANEDDAVRFREKKVAAGYEATMPTPLNERDAACYA